MNTTVCRVVWSEVIYEYKRGPPIFLQYVRKEEDYICQAETRREIEKFILAYDAMTSGRAFWWTSRWQWQLRWQLDSYKRALPGQSMPCSLSSAREHLQQDLMGSPGRGWGESYDSFYRDSMLWYGCYENPAASISLHARWLNRLRIESWLRGGRACLRPTELPVEINH